VAIFGKKKEEPKQTQPTNEEQMLRRQSSPRPTAEGEVERMLMQKQKEQGQIHTFCMTKKIFMDWQNFLGLIILPEK
jgi:hypothetical protein